MLKEDMQWTSKDFQTFIKNIIVFCKKQVEINESNIAQAENLRRMFADFEGRIQHLEKLVLDEQERKKRIQ